MRNITVFSNRLDESNGIVEHVLEMKAKKTPWHLRFAQTAVLAVLGLLFVPPKQAQANHGQFSTPEVTEFYFVTDEASDYDLNHGWSYLAILDPSSAGPEWDNGAEFRESVNGGGYYSVLFWPVGESEASDEWVLLEFYVETGSNASVSAWVTDSDGNYYTVDVTIIYGL